jgi:HECT-domain (ubiquitin-transferase)
MLCDGIALQAEAFRDGIEDFFSVDYLRVFTPEELHRDICGGGDGVDKWTESTIRKLFKLDGGKEAAEALVAVAAIGGEGGNSMSRRFGPTSPTIAFLIKALLEGTPQQRRQFLSFVTSVPIETPGRIEVVPLVSPSGEFLPMSDPSCLPRANTCARRLYLPKFSSYDTGSESFKEVFWAVVREESRFKGFYEWRG